MSLLFLDTEFTGLNQDARLLSIALVPNDGTPWFYAVFTDVEVTTLGSWQREHVVPYLELSTVQFSRLGDGKYVRGDLKMVTAAMREYLQQFPTIVVWADVPAYDWVLFCELFGGARSLLNNIHYIVRDLATLLEIKGHPVDTDRYAFAYGAGTPLINSADARKAGNPPPAKTDRGVLRHNALADAMTCRACYRKLMGKS